MGSFHSFSAGLVIGGKDLKQEQDRLSRMNILVATPGRLLQHMDQTVGFDCSNLLALVLDEADRILDMGFANTLNAIVENLPRDRQTLLFSATQTKRVKDLARLSLKNPEYVGVSENASGDGAPTAAVPKSLEQHYMVLPLEQKLDLLFSFLRTHTTSKLLVFFSSCRQVQFAHETFCKLRPGLSLLCLHGKQKQAKRLQIFTEFTKTQHAALFATDIAARGLDFPAVDWVLQVDAPEDPDTYVHRVGRTARYQSKGNSLLFLLPSEERGMLAKLSTKQITPGRIKPRESKTQSVQNQLQSFLFQSPELKYLGQKAFVSYVRSVHLQKDKTTFDVLELPLEKYAAALGLPGAPKIKFVKEASAARKKAEAKAKALAAAEERSEGTDAKPEADKVRTKYDRMFGRTNQGVLSEHYAKLVADDDAEEDEGATASDVAEGEAGAAPQALVGNDDDGDDDADFLTIKRADHALESDDDEAEQPTNLMQGKTEQQIDSAHLSKRKLQQGQSKKAMAEAGKRGIGTKLTFDDEGKAHELYEMQDEADFKAAGSAAEQASKFVEAEQQRLRASDVQDKERVKEKKRQKRRREKEIERGRNGASSDEEDEEEATGVAVAPEDTRSDGYETPDFDLGDGDSDNDEVSDASSDHDDDDESDDDDDDTPEAEEATGRSRKAQGKAAPSRPSKQQKRLGKNSSKSDETAAAPSNVADDEALALRLLGGS